MTDASMIRLAQSINAMCGTFQREPTLQHRMTILRDMEAAVAIMDNNNREPMTVGMLCEMGSDVVETVRYYREQADNIMAEAV